MEVIQKPDREPDLVVPWAGGLMEMFWFDECIYLNARSEWRRFTVDSADVMTDVEGRRKFHSVVQEARKKWWHEIFESKFCGIEGDDE